MHRTTQRITGITLGAFMAFAVMFGLVPAQAASAATTGSTVVASSAAKTDNVNPTGVTAAKLKACIKPVDQQAMVCLPKLKYRSRDGKAYHNKYVSYYQSRLIKGGYLKIKKPTGYFGKQTVKATKVLQKKHGLKVTGYTDRMTWEWAIADGMK